MRVLHLIDPALCGDEGVLACAAAMGIAGEDRPAEHAAWIVGNDADERRAWALGVDSTDRVGGGWEAGAVRGLRRLREARYGDGGPDIVQCWSARGLMLARRVFGTGDGSPVRVAVIGREQVGDRADDSWGGSDAALATGREVIVTLDLATRAAIAPRIARAVDAARWHHAIRVIEPPVFASEFAGRGNREEVRATLGIEGGEVVVGVLADPPAALDAHRMAFAAGVVYAAGHRAVWIIRRGARDERRAVDYQRKFERRFGLVLADMTLPQLVAASDVCVADGKGINPGSLSPIADDGPSCGVTALSLAVSAGVPVVAFPGVARATASGETWPVLAGKVKSLTRAADPIARMIEDPALRLDLAAAMRGWNDRARARDGFRRVLREIWLEAANVPMLGMGR